MLHKDLPKDQWVPAKDVCVSAFLGVSMTNSSQDVRYLEPHIQEVLKEEAERAAWDTMSVQRK